MAAPKTRPLSPHLSIYKPSITMTMSIVHRLTGVALYVGTLLLALWLITAAGDSELFETIHDFMGTILGRVILLGYTWALVHHALGGVRHLIWDTGRGFGPERKTLSALTLVGSVVVTLGLWVLGYAVR